MLLLDGAQPLPGAQPAMASKPWTSAFAGADLSWGDKSGKDTEVLQPAALAEAARLGLTAQDMEQLVEDLAQREFQQLEKMMESIERQGGSEQDAVDRWAREQSERWVREQFNTGETREGIETREEHSSLAVQHTEATDLEDKLVLTASSAREELSKMKTELEQLKRGRNNTPTQSTETNGVVATVDSSSASVNSKAVAMAPASPVQPVKQRPREEHLMRAKGRADDRAHELALQKQKLEQYKAEMRKEADRHAREVRLLLALLIY